MIDGTGQFLLQLPDCLVLDVFCVVHHSANVDGRLILRVVCELYLDRLFNFVAVLDLVLLQVDEVAMVLGLMQHLVRLFLDCLTVIGSDDDFFTFPILVDLLPQVMSISAKHLKDLIRFVKHLIRRVNYLDVAIHLAVQVFEEF